MAEPSTELTGTHLVGVAALREARGRVARTCWQTPVLPVRTTAQHDPFWVKAESLQRTGSFKIRGATNALATSGERSAAGVVTFSAGNHGKALAYAAQLAGVAATVVMPDTAEPSKIGTTRGYGARVVLCAPDQIVVHALQLAGEQGLLLVPPFDDPAVIAGQGTVGLELLDQLEGLATVLVPVGGGGLLAGVAVAIKSQRPAARVIGVEPELAGDAAEGFRTGVRASWPRSLTGRTVADGLRSPAVGLAPWRHILRLVDDIVTVSEDAIGAAMRMLAEEAKLVVEPSGAVAAAAVLEHPGLLGAGPTVAVATGGNVELRRFFSLVSSG